MHDARVGRTIKGKYRVHRVLGEGGMGVVLAARNERLGRDVAIKFLLPQLTRQPELVARFLHEGQAAAGLRHPHVVDVLDVDSDDDGTPFIVLELLEGESLASLLHRRRVLSVAEAFSILLPVMDGVALAHDHGIVHRDIKPDNIFLHHDGRGTMVPKVLDFGIARPADRQDRRTATSALLGTPAYMAPEQIRSTKSASAGSDVWSMGVVWCETLSGSLPHQLEPEASGFQIMTEIVSSPPRSLRALAPQIDPLLAAVIDKALAMNLADRFGDMRSFAAALSARASTAHASTVHASTSAPGVVGPRAIAATVALASAALPSATPMVASVPNEAPHSRSPVAMVAVALGVGAVSALVVGAVAFKALSPPAHAPPPPFSAAPEEASASASASAPDPAVVVSPPQVQVEQRCDRRVSDPTGTPLNVRAEPDARSTTLGTLPNGTPVELGEQRGRWSRVAASIAAAPIAGWVWSAYLAPCEAGGAVPVQAIPTCPAAPSPDTVRLAHLVSGMDVTWGASRVEVEARCGVAAEVHRSECVARLVDTRRMEGPTGLGHGPIQLSYASSGEGLFEVYAQSDRPREDVIASVERLLGPPDFAGESTRWDVGDERLTVATAGGHTVLRTFHRPRQRRYSAAVRSCE